MKNHISKILSLVPKSNTKDLYLIIFLTIVGSFLEVLGIGLIIPLLTVFMNEDISNNLITFDILNNLNQTQIIFVLLALITIIYFFKIIFLALMVFLQNKYSFDIYKKNSSYLLELYMHKGILFFSNTNSSTLIRNVLSECNLFSFGVIFNILQLASSVVIGFAICITLIIIEPTGSILTLLCFTFFGILIFKSTNKMIYNWGVIRQKQSSLVIKNLQEIFMGIKEIIIYSAEKLSLEKFKNNNAEASKVGLYRNTVVQLPRLILELIGVVSFSLLIIFLINFNKNFDEILIILGVFVLATVRLLPNISKIVKSFQEIKFNLPTINLLDKELSEYYFLQNEIKKKKKVPKILDFRNISFNNVGYNYKKSELVLDKINFEIKSGDKIGIIGKTGSGKTTLINLICGLINPTSGKIFLNGRAMSLSRNDWQKNIAYVPQNVYLIDDTIKNNILFGTDKDKFDINQVNSILQTVDLLDYVLNLPKKYNEIVGEHGGKISGGQAQRVGIARALFTKSQILIFDEATASLDEETEKKVLKSIFLTYKEKTIISISHKPNVLKYCNKIFEIVNGSLKVNENQQVK